MSKENGVTEREKANRLFRGADGSLEPRVMQDVTAVVFKFPHTGEELVMDLDALQPGILKAAAAFGINTSVGNVLGSVKDKHQFHDACTARWETLTGGAWSEGRESGPRIGHLMEAIRRVKKARDGAEPDQAWLDAKRAQLTAPDFDRKVYLNNSAIKSEIDQIRIEELQARVAEAKKAGADVGNLLD